jgi:plasmid stabilization system protein ParE
MKKFSAVFNKRATRETQRAQSWLANNRGLGHVEQLNDEINDALDALEESPEMGVLVATRPRRGPPVRRLILEKSGYHLYYCADRSAWRIEVVSLWHEKRRPPKP